MFTVTKTYRFEAAHSLPLMPEDHKCRRLHGHSYRVTVEAASEKLDRLGMVVEYADIDQAMQPILARLDHQNLNDVISRTTTAENIARFIHEALLMSGFPISRVTLHETHDTSVTYHEDTHQHRQPDTRDPATAPANP